MRRALGLLAVAVAVAAVATLVAAGSPSQSGVTMRVDRFFEQQYGLWRLRFTGAIPSDAANEYVAILHQRCGAPRSSTAIGGASTQAGGSYEAIPRVGSPPQSGTFRALWKGQLSDPVTLRGPVGITLVKLPGRRYLVRVNAESNLSGRFVALQRLSGGRWMHVRRGRLAARGFPGYGGYYTTTFTVRKRGLRLRILVPEKTVAPCHDATASATFVS